jgi:two-component system, sensor histidine kinase and response regulator
MRAVRTAVAICGTEHHSMPQVSSELNCPRDGAQRAAALFDELRMHCFRQTDRLFAGLMVVQWIGGIIAALCLSPRTWSGGESSVNIHVWAAIFIGGGLAAMPLILILTRSGSTLTRHVVAACEMMVSALLIDITGGRIETHFHIFGALALLSFYRDWRVLITASVVAAAHHGILGVLAPQDIYGVYVIQPWRWVEHTGWVVFEDVFLIISIMQSLKEMRSLAERQADLESTNASVEGKVALRTAELEQSRDELLAAREAALAASQAKSEFLSSMSHEIRTPMNAILGMAELIDETPLNSEQKKFLGIMRNNGDALLSLINDILDLAKIEAGRLTLEQVDFDLEGLTDTVSETFGMRAHAKGLELAVHLMPDVPLRLRGDPLRLRQILINIIGNAIKFTETGHVVLSVECDSGAAKPGALRFTVTDTGIGISRDKLDGIFADFSQADSSTTRRYGGSGLGLAIVKRLVALMDGRIWVESKLGSGSAFHFTANFEVNDAPRATDPSTVALMLSGTRTLVVDDIAANRLIVREMLSSRGAEVDEAEDGPRAITLLDRARLSGRPFKLLLLDCRMPGMDGFELIQRIKTAGYDGLPLLMLSSDDLKMDLAHAQELGVDGYLVKPVRRLDLFDAITAAIARRQSENSRAEAESSTGQSESAPQQRRLRILLTDDARDNRVLICAYLKNSQAQIDEAENGMIAVAKASAEKYDVILMDIQMPVMDGLEAIRHIRERERDQNVSPRVPIIALTASALEGDIRLSLDAGADLHVSKPVKKAILLAAIEQLTIASVVTGGPATQRDPQLHKVVA